MPIPTETFIDVTQYGVLPGTDVTVALQELVNTAPLYSTLVFPAGQFNLSASIDWSTQARLSWKGAGIMEGAISGRTGTLIVGAVTGPLLYRSSLRDTSAYLEGIAFSNGDPNGICVQLDLINGASIRRCSFQGNWGLVIGLINRTNTDIGVYDCVFFGNPTQFPNGIGASVTGQGAFYNVVATNWGKVGLQLGNSWSIYRGHFEVNNTAVQLGLSPDQINHGWIGVISHMTGEANLTSIKQEPGSGGVFDAVNLLGEYQSHPGQSQIGIDGAAGVFTELHVGGSYSNANVINYGAPATFINAHLSNGGTGVLWNLPTDRSKLVFINTPTP